MQLFLIASIQITVTIEQRWLDNDESIQFAMDSPRNVQAIFRCALHNPITNERGHSVQGPVKTERRICAGACVHDARAINYRIRVSINTVG